MGSSALKRLGVTINPHRPSPIAHRATLRSSRTPPRLWASLVGRQRCTTLADARFSSLSFPFSLSTPTHLHPAVLLVRDSSASPVVILPWCWICPPLGSFGQEAPVSGNPGDNSSIQFPFHRLSLVPRDPKSGPSRIDLTPQPRRASLCSLLLLHLLRIDLRIDVALATLRIWCTQAGLGG